MKTKFGNAKINNHGYYVITSRKEGNHMKMLHRLIFEDYHDCKLDENDVIHHADFDKTNNHPSNLICMSHHGHSIIHNYNCPLSDKTCDKMSKSRKGEKHWNYGNNWDVETKDKISMTNSITKNTTGYYRVSKRKNSKYKQGFIYAYQYYDENKKRKVIQSIDINELEKKVKAKGLKWEVIIK